ncbi:serine/threonine-protein kinase [Haloferula sp. BvORR071]|uniref:serine/threonine-protein kinase n=1 Tax=Haloferula sp. BvORR071 TaxID=1396141 RepID=UPI000698A404|nr:serine/threonine-protein kinase [Haloferula sp. BvORR071]
MTENSRSCTRCGATLSAAAAAGLCPRCLMAMNFDSNTLPEGEDLPGLPPMSPMSPEELAAKFPQYEILECLGRGGMGVVYKARQKSLKRTVAIKILAPEREHDSRFAARFAHEAELLAKLSHPNIVTIHDFGETEGLFYLVMEYVDGVNLRELLREGRMQPEQALAIVPPVCEALEYAHGKGVVHRDIKPENLLLDREGRIKIADFGIASLVAATGEHSGTPPYMAPEQEGGSVDRRADIYALGVVLYEMLTGERPAKEVVAPSRKVQIEVGIDEIVLRALEKEPQRRYQSAAEFKTMVETMAGTGGVAPLPEEVAMEAPPFASLGRKWSRFYAAFASAFATLWLALFLTGVATQTYIDLGLYGLIGFPGLALLYAAWRIRPAAKPFRRAGRIYEGFSSCFGTLMLLLLLAALATLSKFNVGTPGLAGAAAFSLCYALWRERRAGAVELIEAKPINWSKWVLGLIALALVGGISAVLYQMPRKAKTANFAPEVQRVMQAYPSGVNRFVDFDTGAVLSLPPAIAAQLGDDDALWMLHGSKAPPQDYLDWIDRSGADAVAMRRGLVIFSRACVAGHGNSDTGWGGDWLHWNAISANDVSKAADIIASKCDQVAAQPKSPDQAGTTSYGVDGLSTAGSSGPGARGSYVTSYKLAGVVGENSPIWIFKTRRGSKGVFVFDENDAMPERKQFRLKLVADVAVLSAPIYDYAKEALASLRFEPTLECEVPEALDLDTGKSMQKGYTPEYVFSGLSPELTRENGWHWMQATGMDVIALPKERELRATAMKCVLLAGEAWETLTSAQLQRILADARLEDVQSLADANSAPRVWGFQTREGSMGLLQVAGRGAEGFKLRYKLLELPANAAVNSSFFRELPIPESPGGTDTPDQVLAATPAELLDGVLAKRMILYRCDLALVYGVGAGLARGIVLGCVDGQWRPLPDASMSGPEAALTRTFKDRTGEFMAKLREMPALDSDRTLTAVVEKSVGRQQLGEDGTAFFSFASGKILPPPYRLSYPADDYERFKSTPELRRWMEENQADLLIHLKEEDWKVFRFMSRERDYNEPQPLIEAMSAKDVEKKLGDDSSDPWDPWPSTTAGSSYYPHACSLMSFRTRENLKGVYQLESFDGPSGKGLKLRYRIAGPAAQGSHPVEEVPEAVERE